MKTRHDEIVQKLKRKIDRSTSPALLLVGMVDERKCSLKQAEEAFGLTGAKVTLMEAARAECRRNN